MSHHDHCHGDSCSHEEGNHHHHNHASDGCCVCECCGNHHQHKGKYADQLLELADCAWMEVLKEKIKDQIRASSSHHLDELAKLVSEANHNRWVHKMEGKSNTEDFEANLQALLHKKQ